MNKDVKNTSDANNTRTEGTTIILSLSSLATSGIKQAYLFLLCGSYGYLYVYMYICVHINVCDMSTYKSKFTWRYMLCVYIYRHMSTYIHVCTCIYIYICLRIGISLVYL